MGARDDYAGELTIDEAANKALFSINEIGRQWGGLS